MVYNGKNVTQIRLFTVPEAKVYFNHDIPQPSVLVEYEDGSKSWVPVNEWKYFPELKPCPFCGEQPKAVFDKGYPVCICCGNDECFISVTTAGYYFSLEDAAEVWNNRK